MDGKSGHRKIIHIDMDCFYAAVEMRDNPALTNLPVAVGREGPRGVVATANYVARKHGVHSALPCSMARRRCPQLVFVEPRFEVYKAVSAQIRDIFHEYTDLVEPLSLDEAYLDVTANKPCIPLAMDIAAEIKRKIKRQTQLTASAGVSFNKFLAKIASDWRKPNGLCVIHPAQAQEFVDKVPIEDFWGVGPATARRMHELGITDGASLRKVPLHVLMRHFGKSGRIFYDFARCIDSRPVEPDRIRKSVGCETTLTEDVSDPEAIMRIVEELAADLERRIARSGFRGPTFTLKVKYADFRTHSRSHTYPQALTRREEFVEAARRLLPSAVPAGQLIRLVGIGTGVNTPPSRDHGRWVQLEIDFGEY